MPADPNAVESLFHRARALPPADRAALLADYDAEVREQVARLLAADAELDATGDIPPDPQTRTSADAAPTTAHRPAPEPDAVIGGRYRLVEPIGEGGMGTVWLARQTEPVKRTVAVKLVKAGMDSKAVLARFDAERQALALMDHPNIAKVLDGGVHDGRPFFVMELVKGTPITEFCDARRLTPRQRLELFVPVCQAIQHAHQKGVIHRDIKPSNVLVALYDDQPVPKVIDFGVAKATGGHLTEQTLSTGFGAVVGTPQYMSPEQATFNNLDIDTRSDVYSLGVLLYELLAGSPPFSKKELKEKGLVEMLRVVREEEPPKPSTKLSTADALPSISANRGTEPKALTGLLRSELDWVVMKALEKDRARRYDTANAFAADVLRYLSGEAVQAHPPTAAYRLRKFYRRNRPQVLALGAVFALLVAGVGGTTWNMVRALRAEGRARDEAGAKAAALREEERQRRQATAELGRALAARAKTRETLDLVTSEEAGRVLAGQTGATDEQRRFLEQIVPSYEEFAAEPGEDRQTRERVAGANYRLAGLLYRTGYHSRAADAAAGAVAAYRRLKAEHPADRGYQTALADSLYLRARCLNMFQQSTVAAGESAAEAAACYAELSATSPADAPLRGRWAEALTIRGMTLQDQVLTTPTHPRHAEAEGLLRSAVELYERAARDHPKDPALNSGLARCHCLLATVLIYSQAKRYPEADGVSRRALALAEQVAADFPADPLVRFRLATVLYQRSLLVRREPLDSRSPDYQSRKKANSAELRALLERSAAEYEWYISLYPSDALAARNIGAVCVDFYQLFPADDPAANLGRLGRAIGHLARVLARDPNQTDAAGMYRNALSRRAKSLAALGRDREALADWRALQATKGAPAVQAILRFEFALALVRAGEWAEAEQVAETTTPTDDLIYTPGRKYVLPASARVLAELAAVHPDAVAADRCGRRAVEITRDAIRAGTFVTYPEDQFSVRYDNWAFLRLRDRPDYRAAFGTREAWASTAEAAIRELNARGQPDRARELVSALCRYFHDNKRTHRAAALSRRQCEAVNAAAAPTKEAFAGLLSLAYYLEMDGDADGAERVLREALAAAERLGLTDPSVESCRTRLAGLYQRRGEYPRAEAEWRAVLKQTEAMPAGPSRDTKLRFHAAKLVALYAAWGKPEKAAEWRAKLPPEVIPPPRPVAK